MADHLRPARARNRFSKNSFAEATLSDTAFSYGIDLSDQSLPDDAARYGYVPDLASALARALFSIERWADPDDRRLALAMLEGDKHDVAVGQRQYFMNRDAFRHTVPLRVSDAVWELLAPGE